MQRINIKKLAIASAINSKISCSEEDYITAYKRGFLEATKLFKTLSNPTQQKKVKKMTDKKIIYKRHAPQDEIEVTVSLDSADRNKRTTNLGTGFYSNMEILKATPNIEGAYKVSIRNKTKDFVSVFTYSANVTEYPVILKRQPKDQIIYFRPEQ